MSKNYIFIFLFLSSVACQTLDVREKASFTREQKSFFSECVKSDGYSYLEFYEKNDKKFGGDFEWIIYPDKTYSFEVLAPFGNSLIEGKKIKNKLFIRGSSFKENGDLAIDFDGFLHYKNHWIGLKSDELACFLKGKFSSDWLSQKSYFVGEGRKKFYFPMKDREIFIEFTKDSETNNFNKACCKISWKSFWIFKTSTIKICFEKTLPKVSSINFDDRFELIVKEIYEEE